MLMKKIIYGLFFISMRVYAIELTHIDELKDSGLVLTLELAQTEFLPYEPVYVYYTIKNPTDHPISYSNKTLRYFVRKYHTYRYHPLKLRVRWEDKIYEHQYPRERVTTLKTTVWTLAPHTEFKRDYRRAYFTTPPLINPGTYTISLTIGEDTVYLESNPIEITIKVPDESDTSVLDQLRRLYPKYVNPFRQRWELQVLRKDLDYSKLNKVADIALLHPGSRYSAIIAMKLIRMPGSRHKFPDCYPLLNIAFKNGPVEVVEEARFRMARHAVEQGLYEHACEEYEYLANNAFHPKTRLNAPGEMGRFGRGAQTQNKKCNSEKQGPWYDNTHGAYEHLARREGDKILEVIQKYYEGVLNRDVQLMTQISYMWAGDVLIRSTADKVQDWLRGIGRNRIETLSKQGKWVAIKVPAFSTAPLSITRYAKEYPGLYHVKVSGLESTFNHQGTLTTKEFSYAFHMKREEDGTWRVIL